MSRFGERAADRRTTQRLERLRAQGAPTSAEERDLYYDLPSGSEDVTGRLLNALAGVEAASSKSIVATLPVVGEGPPVPTLNVPWAEQEAVAAFVQDLQVPLSQLHEAAEQKAYARYPLDFRAGIGMLLPHAAGPVEEDR